MATQIHDCIRSSEDLSNHGCFYLVGASRGARSCGSPCVQQLITENIQLKKQIEDLTQRLNEVKGEI